MVCGIFLQPKNSILNHGEVYIVPIYHSQYMAHKEGLGISDPMRI